MSGTFRQTPRRMCASTTIRARPIGLRGRSCRRQVCRRRDQGCSSRIEDPADQHDRDASRGRSRRYGRATFVRRIGGRRCHGPLRHQASQGCSRSAVRAGPCRRNLAFVGERSLRRQATYGGCGRMKPTAQAEWGRSSPFRRRTPMRIEFVTVPQSVASRCPSVDRRFARPGERSRLTRETDRWRSREAAPCRVTRHAGPVRRYGRRPCGSANPCIWSGPIACRRPIEEGGYSHRPPSRAAMSPWSEARKSSFVQQSCAEDAARSASTCDWARRSARGSRHCRR